MAKARVNLKALDEQRKKAEKDTEYLARLMNPGRVYGDIHRELFWWMNRVDGKDNLLALIPRAHQKSHCAAVKVVHEIIKNPAITVLYVSATAELAEGQLRAIKQMLESDAVQVLWPDLIHPDESKRKLWNVSDIIVDHPARKNEGVRDSTVAARSITANITGLHADLIVLDDMVVPNNAYTEEGRNKVEALYSQLSSIKNPGARTIIVGTRYHPADIYGKLQEMEETVFDEEGEIIGSAPVFDVMERVVEEQGVYLWPRERRTDGKYYGFDDRVLAKIKAGYSLDMTQFYAQYYNDPNDPTSERLSRSKFQHYDKKFLERNGMYWEFKGRRLNVVAAMDFAFSLNKKADYTAIVVIGIDPEHSIYVLDIDRFKSDRISDYYDHILDMYMKWGFRKLRADTTAAQVAIVRELKNSYIKPNGIALSIDENTRTRHEGTKAEWIASILEPRYENMQVWHYPGGNCHILEEELVSARPKHDDIKDALASAVEIAVAPTQSARPRRENNVIFDSRFGGVRFR